MKSLPLSQIALYAVVAVFAAIDAFVLWFGGSIYLGTDAGSVVLALVFGSNILLLLAMAAIDLVAMVFLTFRSRSSAKIRRIAWWYVVLVHVALIALVQSIR